MERLGVFGGTFDPVHVGHVVVATESRAQLGLDRVLLVVAGDPWQKRGEVVASAADRLALVDAAVDGVDGVEASAIEIEREARRRSPPTPWRRSPRPIGSCSSCSAPTRSPTWATWRRLEETRDLATVVVVERAGDVHAEPPGPGWRVERVTIPRLDISSTDLRERLRSGRPIDGLVPPAVVRAIHARGLYTDGR